MSNSVITGLAASMLIATACASADTPQPSVDGPARPSTQDAARASPSQSTPKATQRTSPDKPDAKAVAEAQDLLKQGLAAYNVGAYDEAESLLKRSITIYPFLAPANLALGKVFLLKGAANHDDSLIESARLMFDMAHSIDPSLREPVVMLELFKPRGAN